MGRVGGFVVVAAVALIGATSAWAAFPGGNGRIAFERGGNIWTANPDDSGELQLTAGAGTNSQPAWSADGRRIAFVSDRDGNKEIYVMAGDGTGQTRVTNDTAPDDFPSWSPDGQRIAFQRGPQNTGEIYITRVDGTGLVSITNGLGGRDPDWSPDGQKIAFAYDNDIFVMNSDGSGRTDLTQSPPNTRDRFVQPDGPDWSPDGRLIAYHNLFGGGPIINNEIRVMDADGANNQTAPNTDLLDSDHPAFSPDGAMLTYACGSDVCFTSDFSPLPTASSPDWQPGPAGFPRPRSATLLRGSLVPAYLACSFPGTSHGAPLAYPSCNPPRLASPFLTMGTSDANGLPSNGVGSVIYRLIPGNPATPADEADVRIGLAVTDVRNRPDLSDYAGELALDTQVQITDRDNAGSFEAGSLAGTTTPIDLQATVPCAATGDARVGSTCTLATTQDALTPGAVREGKRAVWELGQVRVFDGGSDGQASTGGNRLFLIQGIFVP